MAAPSLSKIRVSLSHFGVVQCEVRQWRNCGMDLFEGGAAMLVCCRCVERRWWLLQLFRLRASAAEMMETEL